MSNPWLLDEWNYTAQGQFIKEHGLEAAHKAAMDAGTTLNGKPKQPEGTVRIERHWIIRKISGGGLVGAGSSGSGSPP